MDNNTAFCFIHLTKERESKYCIIPKFQFSLNKSGFWVTRLAVNIKVQCHLLTDRLSHLDSLLPFMPMVSPKLSIKVISVNREIDL